MYRTGTIDVTNGSKNVVGHGTLFTLNVKAGDLVGLDEATSAGFKGYEVASISDDTHLALVDNYQGTTAATQAYAVAQIAAAWNNITGLYNALSTFFSAYSTALSLSGSDKVLTLNKVATANNAGVTLQDNGATQARIGIFGDDNFHVQIGTGFTDALVVNTTTGYVGIGKAPTSVLDISLNQNAATVASLANTSGGTAAQLYFQTSNGTHQLLVGQTGSAFAGGGVFIADCCFIDATGPNGLAIASGGAVKFAVNGATAEVARFDTAGSLCIASATRTLGTSSGQVAIENGSNSLYGIIVHTSVATAANLIGFLNPNGTVGQIQTSGTATSYLTSSDKNLKVNDTARTVDSGALIDALPTRCFNWKADGSKGFGFFAQEAYAVLSEVVPAAVSVGSDDDELGTPTYQHWGVDMSWLVPVLWSEARSLRARVAALEAKLAV